MLTPSGPRPADRIGYPEQGLLVTALVVIAERGSWLAGEVNSFDDPVSYTHLDVYKRQVFAVGWKFWTLK